IENVIPANAGIWRRIEIPAFAGMTRIHLHALSAFHELPQAIMRKEHGAQRLCADRRARTFARSQGMRRHAARRLRDQTKVERSDYAPTGARARLREAKACGGMPPGD